jgi:hypothetical protein
MTMVVSKAWTKLSTWYGVRMRTKVLKAGNSPSALESNTRRSSLHCPGERVGIADLVGIRLQRNDKY